MTDIDTAIINTNKIICRHLDNINGSERGVISQDILANLKKFVELIMLKYYYSCEKRKDIGGDIEKAIENAQENSHLVILYRFRNYLEIVASRYTLGEDSAERLMLKYYDFLLEMKSLLYKDFHMRILHNLDKFPLQQDTALQEYYSKIADKLNQHTTSLTVFDGNEKYYVQTLKPFFVNGHRYYEVTFVPARDTESKTSRIIAFTKLPIMSNYASLFQFENEKIEILGKTMPILLIVGWEVSIRACEFKNFSSIITGENNEIPYGEQWSICRLLTETNYTLTELMDFSDNAYRKYIEPKIAEHRTSRFFAVLDSCRKIIKEKKPGHNVLRYLLYEMRNTIIKNQREYTSNNSLSNLYLKNKCIPFDSMPFFKSLVGHNPRFNKLSESIKIKGRLHEILGRLIRNNTEISGRIFTPIEDLYEYKDLNALTKQFNDLLWHGHRERNHIVLENGYAFINEYKLDTCEILKTLSIYSTIENPNYESDFASWFLYGDYTIDSVEKVDILKKMFSKSSVAVIYGSAGVGKSTLVNHISHFYENSQKLFLTQTNPAIDNLKRRVTANENNCQFSTIASFLMKNIANDIEYELLVIDECSTVNNKDMRAVLSKAHFKHILLVGDTYQINSIRFGNWFTALRSFLPTTSVFDLTMPYRTADEDLLKLWSKVRFMDDDVQETIDKHNHSLKVDNTLFLSSSEDEAVLCLNYNGLYGVNNINRFLQESNPNPPIKWGVQQFKVGDPVLFLEENRFHRLIYNNMRGKIINIKKVNEDTPFEKIQFEIELNVKIEESFYYPDLEFIEKRENDKTIIRFFVNMNLGNDGDDDINVARTIVPFQIAYAVSIHKAQGLEYDSVKLVITDEVDELITHNIFYTAITRARKTLKIYWTPEVEKKVLSRIKPRNIDADIEILKQYISPINPNGQMM